MTRQKVLIVDDERDILRSTTMLLNTLGYDAVPVSDHRQVVATAEREAPDLILQDLKMPGLNLGTLIKDLRANPATSRIPFAFFSASPHLDQVAVEHDALGVIRKPFDETELIDMIHRARDVRTSAEGVH